MPFEDLIKALQKQFAVDRVMCVPKEQSKELIPELSDHLSSISSISGISPTILNLKSDLERLYKPRRSF